METRIYCDVKSCKNQSEKGICEAETIHLNACTPDADNVVGCAEFDDKSDGESQ
jgi:hypothetical protein